MPLNKIEKQWLRYWLGSMEMESKKDAEDSKQEFEAMSLVDRETSAGKRVYDSWQNNLGWAEAALHIHECLIEDEVI